MNAPSKIYPLKRKTDPLTAFFLSDVPSSPGKKMGEWTFIGRHLEAWEAEGWIPEVSRYKEFTDFFHLAGLLANTRELEILRHRCPLLADYLPKKKSILSRGIQDILPLALGFLASEGKGLDLEISRMGQETQKISRHFSKMELLWEKVHDVLLKIPPEENRLHLVKAQLDERKGAHGRFLEDVVGARKGLAEKLDRLQEVDCMLPLLPEYPLSLALCKDLIQRNREDLLTEQKNIKNLWERYGSLQEEGRNHVRRYEVLLNSLSGLQADKSFYVDALSRLLRQNEVRIRFLREKSVKILLRLAKAQIFLDAFPAPCREFASTVDLHRQSMKEMEGALRRGMETLRNWKGSIQDLGAEDPLYVSVRTQTLLEATRKDLGILSPPPDREEIAILLRRNYAQEEEVHAFELDRLANILSEKSPASSLEVMRDAPVLAIHQPRQNGAGPGWIGIFRNLKKRREAAQARKMEYPGTRRGLYIKKATVLLAAAAVLGYCLQGPSQKVDARVAEAGKPQDAMAVAAGRDIHAGREVQTQIYGAAKIKTASETPGDPRGKWAIFLPVFENFSVHWSPANRPMLINKSGKIPGSRSLETLGLFQEIEKRVEAEYFGFFSRLFMDFIELGLPPREALQFILLNEKRSVSLSSAERQVRYVGRNRPVPQLENRGFKSFVEAMAPYIAEQYSVYSKKLGMPSPPNLSAYAKVLAEDIYFSSRAFGVPLTSMVSVAHQETFFMNIFGDGLKSVGPFQLYEPTRELIAKEMREAGLRIPDRVEHLEDHITLSTYMAVFHFSTLMRRYTSPGGPVEVVVDLDKSMKLYNGSPLYPFRVFQKNLQLKKYLETTQPS